MRRHNFLVIMMMVCGVHCLAQTSFRYKRDITGVQQEGWYNLYLPADMFRHLNRGLSDLRMYSVTGIDTVEIPYLMEVLADDQIREDVHLPLINTSYRDGELFLMVEPDPDHRINHLKLTFDQTDFFAFVTIEGSDDRREWFEIVTDRRMVSIGKNGTEYVLSTLDFPLTNYRYLRLRVRSDKKLSMRSASFARHEVRPGEHREIPLHWEMETDKKARRSYVHITLNDYVPVDRIRVYADSTSDYYRSFSIGYVRDSAQSDKGWVKYYTEVFNGHLTSYTPNAFNFPYALAREIRLVIHDRDNASLDIRDIKVEGPEVRLVARLSPGDNIMLYGADWLPSPDYDLVHFGNKIPDEAVEVGLGPETILAPAEGKSPPLLQNRLWLWSIMVVVIGLLGFFTLRMMKQR